MRTDKKFQRKSLENIKKQNIYGTEEQNVDQKAYERFKTPSFLQTYTEEKK